MPVVHSVFYATTLQAWLRLDSSIHTCEGCRPFAKVAKVAKVQPLASSLLRIMINTEILEKISIW